MNVPVIIISWIKENHMSMIDWIITIAAVVIPLMISRRDKHKIIDKKNMFKGYIVYIIKAVFFYFMLVCILFGMGNILHISNLRLGKKAYLIVCIIISGLLYLFAGIQWMKHVHMKAKAGKHNNLFTFVLVILPIFFQIVLYGVAVEDLLSPRYWIVFWTILNFLVVLIAAFTVQDYDSFEYQNVVLSLDGDDQKYVVEPEALSNKGSWIFLNKKFSNGIMKFREESIKKVEYHTGNKKTSGNTMKFEDKIFYCCVCFFYLLIIGIVSQFLFRAVIQPIVVTEHQIILERGDYYQLEAVPLDPDTGKLHYTSNSPAIVVFENGIIMTSSELSEDETISAQIMISDDLGNTATVQVKVK